MSDMRALIREILAEELGKLRDTPKGVTEEVVQIRSNADLAAFVTRLLNAAQDGRLRADIEAGRHVFRLSDSGAAQIRAHQPLAPTPQAHAPIRFERGLVSERDIAAIPREAHLVTVGKSVRFTPLARDELRRRGIKVERAST